MSYIYAYPTYLGRIPANRATGATMEAILARSNSVLIIKQNGISDIWNRK
jgi:hypothetical protein